VVFLIAGHLSIHEITHSRGAPENRGPVMAVLLLEGYPVREATNGAEAFRIIDGEQPRLSLLSPYLRGG